MQAPPLGTTLSRLTSDYGMLLALAVLCAFFSYVTWDEQHPEGESAGRALAGRIAADYGEGGSVLVVARDSQNDAAFAQALRHELTRAGFRIEAVVTGRPADARRAFEDAAGANRRIDVIAANQAVGQWAVLHNLGETFPSLGDPPVVTPTSYYWPNFLKTDNLRNVANQIVVIAIIAVGMTLVIITGGIDLSVGSLIALSAVVCALLIRDAAGAERAGAAAMVFCALGGIAVCAAMGLFSGVMVTAFGIPPFIVTLGMMLVASGLAFILAGGQSVYQLPESFVWLGREADLLGIPNAVALMVLLYAAAHVLMTRMALGRYVYAVGGNAEAARLSGVPVKRVLLFVYTLCGALAGLGGVVTASQLKSGDPKYGETYELFVIAAVVVGGTSLSGGEGKVLGTLIGAFIIAVIRNGMNLTGVESYTQKVILGLVILGAVLLDVVKKRGWGVVVGRRA